MAYFRGRWATPGPKVNIRGYGHSIVAGANATNIGVNNFMAIVRDTLDPSVYTMTYLGRGGFTTAALLPLAAADVDAFLVDGKANVFLYMNIINGLTAAEVNQTIEDHRQMYLQRRAAGWDFIIAYTLYYVAYFTAEERAGEDLVNQAHRDWVGTGLLDGVVDIANDSRFAVTGPPGVSDVVDDNVHPNNLGHSYIAEDSLPVINGLYASRIDV
jgi:hypothetical protein